MRWSLHKRVGPRAPPEVGLPGPALFEWGGAVARSVAKSQKETLASDDWVARQCTLLVIAAIGPHHRCVAMAK